MAGFFTRFSHPLDVGTPDNAAQALDLYRAVTAAVALDDPPSRPAPV
ncbi:hypothetical protein AiwAL_19400 [Acidiphilium sp. AL]|nr:hypothetical protein [Acidiphilium sp. AL]MCU4162215.1 hypothetical protein [Acidiphilium sp. AL]